MSIGIDFYRLAVVLKTEIGNKNKIYFGSRNSTRTIWRAEPSPMTCLSVCLFVSVCLLYCLAYTYMYAPISSNRTMAS